MGLHVHPWNAKWLISVDASRSFNRILKSLYQITEQMPLFSWKRVVETCFPYENDGRRKIFPVKKKKNRSIRMTRIGRRRRNEIRSVSLDSTVINHRFRIRKPRVHPGLND